MTNRSVPTICQARVGVSCGMRGSRCWARCICWHIAHYIFNVLIDSITHMSEHVNVSSRCPGGIRVSSPGSQHVDLLALQSDCLSTRCRHPSRAHPDRARRLAAMDVCLADDQASLQRSPSRGSVACCSLSLVVTYQAFELRIARD